MKNPLLVPELRELLASNNVEDLKEFCSAIHPADAADFLSGLEPPEIWDVLSRIEPRVAAEIFVELDEETQVAVISLLKRHEFARLVTVMSPDERADLVKRLPEDKRESLLPSLAQAEREDIRRLTAYPEGTAGSVMTSDYATLSPGLTAAEAIEKLRREAPDKETIYYAYVVDERRKLLGFVSLKDLILAKGSTRVEDLMREDVIFANANDDQEDAARKIAKYDLIALPVVNDEGTLVGIITYDDAMDVLSQENQEDIEKLMAIAGPHEEFAYMRTSAWSHFRHRCGWIVVLAVLGLVSGAIVQNFEGLLIQFAILATFMPMLADTGGNTGSQSATLVVRALALGEITPRDAGRVIVKEFGVAILLALVLAVVAFGRVLLFGHGATIPAGFSLYRIGVAIALALGLQVVSSTLIGALLPLGAARLKFDPAVIASPALTTIVDITGLLIYFWTAKLILGL